MNKELRKLIIKSLNSGQSSVNICNEISILLYGKIVYNAIIDLDNRLCPADFQSNKYKEINMDVERIIKNLNWDRRLILDNFNNWVGIQ